MWKAFFPVMDSQLLLSFLSITENRNGGLIILFNFHKQKKNMKRISHNFHCNHCLNFRKLYYRTSKI